ncbi:unnamed protein product [Strongylus vulgaris]|uniref:Uncharacterized protein n=1 Tax=Strongylus vulgaris TaxID=40348 RepID=A0A3P7I9F8_STRVU|nr:unnamed protein product [Strongylus vulgaris]
MLKEAELLYRVGYDVFNTRVVDPQLGLWAYGYTNYPKDVNDALKNMSKSDKEFAELLLRMEYAEISDFITTQKAIEAINAMNEKQLNCLVFFTAQVNTKELPKINPKNEAIKTIVAVGLNGTDPIDLVPAGAKAVSVPYHYLDEDVTKIVRAIVDDKPWTTRGPTTTGTTRGPTTTRTTRKITTTKPKPPEGLKCLVVGDLYNFAKDEEKYIDVSLLI